MIEASRLDIAVGTKLSVARNRAVELIKSGSVLYDGTIVKKPSLKIVDLEKLEIVAKTIYVSRAAGKLKSFLDNHSFSVNNKDCLDIGSSTGGFTQVLLEYGAKSVTCVDTGKEQLHQTLRGDSKVELYEETDIRSFESDKRFDLVTCDVSFISLKKIIKDIDRLGKKDIILLFKPQFEVGKDAKRDRRGVVTDTKIIEESKENFLQMCIDLGWNLESIEQSSVIGKEGNIEFIYKFFKSEL